MASSAAQTQYRDEYIAGFEQHPSLLTMTATTEAVVKGNTAVFLVADSGSAEAVTRGINGQIPSRNDNLTQNSCTLTEWHDMPQKTGFNIFQSQSNQRQIMQETSRGVLGRKRDQLILTELATATQDTGTTQTASLQMVLRAKTILGNNSVPFDGNIFGVITPAFEAYLLQVSEFSNADYVPVMPMAGADTAFRDTPMMYRWLGINWIVHPNLSGKGTTAEKCFLYHKSAIGTAANTNELQALSGYNDEQDYYWTRTSVFMGAKLLQNSGVVVLNHDGSALVAE